MDPKEILKHFEFDVGDLRSADLRLITEGTDEPFDLPGFKWGDEMPPLDRVDPEEAKYWTVAADVLEGDERVGEFSVTWVREKDPRQPHGHAPRIDIYVNLEPQAQRRGFSRALLAKIEEAAHKLEVTDLYGAPLNEPSSATLEALGFERIGGGQGRRAAHLPSQQGSQPQYLRRVK